MRSPCLAALLLLAGCAGGRPDVRPEQARAEIVRSARAWLGRSKLTYRGRTLPADCWALPAAASARGGGALTGGGSDGLNRFAARGGRLYSGRAPLPGDLVFLDGGAGRLHVGIVGEVQPDGTVLVYQRMARGVVAYHMNAAHPDDEAAPGSGRPWNDRIAAAGGSRLAGQLFAGYAAVLP